MPTTSRLLMTSVALVVAVIFLAPGQADADLSSPSSSSPTLGTLLKTEVQSSSTFNSSSTSFLGIHSKTVDEDEDEDEDDEDEEVHLERGVQELEGGKEDYYGANAAILAWIEGHWWVILIIVVIVAIIAGAICCFIYTKK